MSNTLALAKLTLFFIFLVVVLDTVNDVIPQTQLVEPQSKSAKTKSAHRRHFIRRKHAQKKRDVSKDKYWLLGFVFLICMGSYIARHPNVAKFWERLAAAWKGNPIPNRADEIEEFMISYLKQHQDAGHEEWFLRALVAKRGGDPFKVFATEEQKEIREDVDKGDI